MPTKSDWSDAVWYLWASRLRIGHQAGAGQLTRWPFLIDADAKDSQNPWVDFLPKMSRKHWREGIKPVYDGLMSFLNIIVIPNIDEADSPEEISVIAKCLASRGVNNRYPPYSQKQSFSVGHW